VQGCTGTDADDGWQESWLISANCVCLADQAGLQRLFPGLGEGLFPGRGNAGGDESDEEAIEALTEVLDKLGGPQSAPDVAA